MEQKQVIANYLVTKDDLYQFAIAAIKDQDNKIERWCCRFDWTCYGNIRSDRGYLSYNFCFSKNHLSVDCFAGLAVGLYYDTLHPYLMRKQINVYVNKEKCQSELLFL